MRQLLLFVLVLTSTASIFGQHLPGEMIVQFQEEVEVENWLKEWNTAHTPLRIDRQLSRPTNIWLLRYATTIASPEESKLLADVRQNIQVRSAQFNHEVTLRSLPNDALFDQQWWLRNTVEMDNDLDADNAWDLTSGGLTGLGDTIVLAIIDNGIDLQHEDLQRNLWVNHAEVPDNGIDDDNNGYVDDYRGWSIVTDDDNVEGGGHGTPVAGIAGADGNNSIGVAGVNWNVKLMIVKNNFIADEARVLEAYSYPLEQRIRYHESGGQEGAFVVATNASWGRKLTPASAAPVWCNFYDFLGQHGIINIAATANEEVDVEELGDLPTTCTSDFLISVTNINRNLERVNPSGYGAVSIDLAAYGFDVLTTFNGNSYRSFQGTSAAAPQVAGAAALLYSLNCPSLLNLTQSDPAAAALLVREAILQSATPTPSLTGITTTGGRLNLRAALAYLRDRCEGCIGASSVRVGNILDTSVQIHWNTNDSLERVDLRWREQGSTSWTTLLDVVSPYSLTDLTACTDYEYELRSVCQSETIPFGDRRSFRTEGCCEAPAILPATNLSNANIRLRWEPVFAAQSYNLRYRPQGTADWTSLNQTDTTVFLTELNSCTTYEWQIRTVCENENTAWLAAPAFTTLGCGPCLDLEYCIPDDMNPESEYIQRVEFDGLFTNTSTRPNEGYTDYGTSLGLITMEQGALYPFELTPAYVGQAYDDAWRIWIDLDHNGQFTSNEIVYSSPGSSREAVQGELQIPADARLGLTRMRIMMRFLSVGNACPFGENNFGEVEDYCVEIIPSSVCPAPGNLMVSDRSLDSVTLSWAAVGPAINYRADYRAADQVEWLSAGTTNEEMLTLSGLDTCTTYLFRVKSLCFATESEDFRNIEFTSSCISTLPELLFSANDWIIYPNPVQAEGLKLAAQAPTIPPYLEVRIHNGLGQYIGRYTWQTVGILEVPTANWSPGLYHITLWDTGKLVGSQKVIR